MLEYHLCSTVYHIDCNTGLGMIGLYNKQDSKQKDKLKYTSGPNMMFPYFLIAFKSIFKSVGQINCIKYFQVGRLILLIESEPIGNVSPLEPIMMFCISHIFLFAYSYFLERSLPSSLPREPQVFLKQQMLLLPRSQI